MRRALPLVLAGLAACHPPAADDYVERVPLDRARGEQRAPIASPQVEGAIWARSGGIDRIVYGKPGQAPLLALECAGEGAQRTLAITRFAEADPQAKALMALVGNGHIARLKIDAAWNGKAWLWQGSYAPGDPRLEVLTGPREVEATIPGAGTLKLNPSPRPPELVERCRRLTAPEDQPTPPAVAETVPPA